MHSHLRTLALLVAASSLFAEDAPKFRTDADGPVGANKDTRAKGKDKSKALEWFQLVDGKFPPQGSAHAISGELIQVDHLERRFHLRVDRNDSQDRGVWDLPVDAVMLPYGSIYYHGAPAALQDIPLGTHLHGLFYLKAPNDKTPPPLADYNRKTPEVDFRRCFQLEDDFTFRARQKQLWKVDSVDLTTKKLVATLHADGAAIGKPQSFDLLTSTRVLQGNGFGKLESLKPGQLVLCNITWGTLYGPGRILKIWLDEASRQEAVAHQLERHRNHVRERGLPGWVDAVDDEAQIVTITFFGNVDPQLFDELSAANVEPLGSAPTKPEDKPKPKAAIAVARESLMTYDPVNDRKGGTILDIKKVPVEPGSSGVRIRVQCDMLLEGFRPRRIVRFYPAAWKVVALPREEQFFGRE
jgi:hypothetical protein